MIKLRSIPPANRSLSSMRAATQRGMACPERRRRVFVGSAKPAGPEPSRAHIVEPDAARVAELREYRLVVRRKIQWLEEQALAAGTPEERTAWERELERLAGAAC